MRIVVLGYLIRGPLGGASWHFMQYVIGLKKLGHKVLFLEDSDNYESCYNPDTYEITADPTYGINFIDKLFQKYDLAHSWGYFDEHTNQFYGLSKEKIIDFCNKADILINIANINPLREWWMHIPIRILLDTDPAFTQIKHLKEKKFREIAEHHTHYFSFGENFGKTTCKIPDDGFKWKPTRQPVVLDLWEVASPKPNGKWTTVMLWDSYKVREYNGLTFGMKSASFDEYFHLPEFLNDPFELAVGSATAPRQRLIKAKWKISDSSTVALTPESFQNYIKNSKGEWSIAKQGYVVSNSGWFSERSAGYLATGRPVVLQDTGFSEILPVGKGLMAFTNLVETIEQIETVNADYKNNCLHARKIAEEYFSHEKVLGNLLKNIE